MTCTHPDCSQEAVHPDHPLCRSHAWAAIAAIFEALAGLAIHGNPE